MDFAGIYHKTSEQMSYALNEKELIINLKTGYDVNKENTKRNLILGQVNTVHKTCQYK